MESTALAKDILDQIKKSAGVTHFPKSMRGWCRLVCHLRMSGVPIQWWFDFECDPSFQAALDHHLDTDLFYISMNPFSGERWICRYFLHELVEFFAYRRFPNGATLPASRAGYSDHVDFRHDLALRAESIVFGVPIDRVQVGPDPA